ncbi:MAG: hypothetical protein ACXIU8_02750 [Alkalilacustris sp.]
MIAWSTATISDAAADARAEAETEAYAYAAATASAAAEAYGDAAFAASAAACCAASAASAMSWGAVAKDRLTAAKDTAPSLQPFWPHGTNPLAQEWQSATAALKNAGPERAVWIDWDERCLQGAPQDWDGLLTDIAVINSADWNKSPKHIADIIER